MTSKNKHNKILAVFLAFMILLMSACSDINSTPAKLSEEENKKLVALLGDLNENAPDSVKNKIGTLLHNVETLTQAREDEGNYLMTRKEHKIWKNITKLLDKETMYQFGEMAFEDNKKDDYYDYGQDVIDNLSYVISKQDVAKINQLRDKYFRSSNQEIIDEIKLILDKYESLDTDAVVLNLFDDTNQKNIGMFNITPDFKAVYQSGLQNGLKDLSISEQKSLQNSWKAVTDILPVELFANFKYFKVGGDGELGTFAYVIPVDDRGKTWCMTVDPDDIKNDGIFPYTVVHEMSHYISLNESQVDYKTDSLQRYPQDVYDDGQCVAKDNSYLQAYYDLFWKDIINDWKIDNENPYFYYRHKSEFVTGYSASQCAEDFAETFSAYMLMDKAETPKIQAKFDFFNSYDEFKKLKQDILKNIKNNNVYVNPTIEIDYNSSFEEAA